LEDEPQLPSPLRPLRPLKPLNPLPVVPVPVEAAAELVVVAEPVAEPEPEEEPEPKRSPRSERSKPPLEEEPGLGRREAHEPKPNWRELRVGVGALRALATRARTTAAVFILIRLLSK
jgi:hypothetical protein